ncbi:50S ribosomal protein L20 [bacterium B13(2017)]|nr:50S ribosomal protein L20 [bacterium B13(2017)]
MTRVTNVPASKARRNKELKRAKGFRGRNKNTNRITSGVVKKAKANEFIGRKLRKRDMRKLWIIRIGIAARNNNTKYSSFISALQKLNIAINRKLLADLAVTEKTVFSHLVNLTLNPNTI